MSVKCRQGPETASLLLSNHQIKIEESCLIMFTHANKMNKVECVYNTYNKTKVISADLLDFYFDFEDIYI